MTRATCDGLCVYTVSLKESRLLASCRLHCWIVGLLDIVPKTLQQNIDSERSYSMHSTCSFQERERVSFGIWLQNKIVRFILFGYRSDRCTLLTWLCDVCLHFVFYICAICSYLTMNNSSESRAIGPIATGRDDVSKLSAAVSRTSTAAAAAAAVLVKLIAWQVVIVIEKVTCNVIARPHSKLRRGRPIGSNSLRRLLYRI